MPGLPRRLRQTIRGIRAITSLRISDKWQVEASARARDCRILNILKATLVSPTPEITPNDTKNSIAFTKTQYTDRTNLYWKSGSGGVTKSDNFIGNITSPYDHTGLSNGTPYYYRLAAVDVDGEADLGPEVSGTPDNSTPTMDRTMRHGTWFASGVKKRMYW